MKNEMITIIIIISRFRKIPKAEDKKKNKYGGMILFIARARRHRFKKKNFFSIVKKYFIRHGLGEEKGREGGG